MTDEGTPRYSVCRPDQTAIYDTDDRHVAIGLRDREREAGREADTWDWSVPGIIEAAE